jgi:anti-sigma factor RsiW
MKCHRIQESLAAYQDGEIGGRGRERIAAHLEQCPDCRNVYAELEQVWQELEKIPEIETSPGFERRLFAGIRTTPEPRSLWGFSWLSWVCRAYAAPATAALVLLVGLALGGVLGNALMTGFASSPAPMQISRADADIVSFRVFAAVPPGTLGDGYLRMANYTEDNRR